MTNNNHSLFEVKCLTQFAITLVVRAGHSECSPTLRVNCRHFLENYQHHLGQFDTQDRFHASKKEIKRSQLEYHYNSCQLVIKLTYI